ncbi:MAG TPA: ABC transporter ATP-binding protein, partial [Terriglobales bacterium]|nr:ABC transporter ATP-binding protein [Terriglobales bacterium]
MRQLTRLLRYLAPYSWQFMPSVLLLAGVGFLDAFRVLLIGPILGRVLNPSTGSDNIVLFTIPRTHHAIYLQQFVPSRFHNAWTIVAFAF